MTDGDVRYKKPYKKAKFERGKIPRVNLKRVGLVLFAELGCWSYCGWKKKRFAGNGLDLEVS